MATVTNKTLVTITKAEFDLGNLISITAAVLSLYFSGLQIRYLKPLNTKLLLALLQEILGGAKQAANERPVCTISHFCLVGILDYMVIMLTKWRDTVIKASKGQ